MITLILEEHVPKTFVNKWPANVRITKRARLSSSISFSCRHWQFHKHLHQVFALFFVLRSTSQVYFKIMQFSNRLTKIFITIFVFLNPLSHQVSVCGDCLMHCNFLYSLLQYFQGLGLILYTKKNLFLTILYANDDINELLSWSQFKFPTFYSLLHLKSNK